MTDTPEKALREAEEWLISAKDKLAIAEDEEEAANVCCALAIHAIIRANDAICLKFEKRKPTKHDDISYIFEKLIRKEMIGKENLGFVRLLEKAMFDKSGADYGKKEFTFEDAQDYVERAEEFMLGVKRHI